MQLRTSFELEWVWVCVCVCGSMCVCVCSYVFVYACICLWVHALFKWGTEDPFRYHFPGAINSTHTHELGFWGSKCRHTVELLAKKGCGGQIQMLIRTSKASILLMSYLLRTILTFNWKKFWTQNRVSSKYNKLLCYHSWQILNHF